MQIEGLWVRRDALRALLDNAVPPRQGLMLSMQR